MGRSMVVDKKLKSELMNLLQETLRSQIELDDGESLRSHSNTFKRQIRSYLEPYTTNYVNDHSEMDLLIESAVETEFPDAQVREWGASDKKGVVYGWSTEISLNYVDNDGEIILLMAHAVISKAEISNALRLKRFYDEKQGTNARLMLITKSISEQCRMIAEDMGIEVIKMT